MDLPSARADTVTPLIFAPDADVTVPVSKFTLGAAAATAENIVASVKVKTTTPNSADKETK